MTVPFFASVGKSFGGGGGSPRACEATSRGEAASSLRLPSSSSISALGGAGWFLWGAPGMP